MTAIGSPAEESFEDFLRFLGDVPPWSREFRFHPERKWRFDFAWPEAMFAVEIEGLTADAGRHQRIAGFTADAEKYEAALELGWTVYRVPASWVVKGNRRIWRERTGETVRRFARSG